MQERTDRGKQLQTMYINYDSVMSLCVFTTRTWSFCHPAETTRNDFTHDWLRRVGRRRFCNSDPPRSGWKYPRERDHAVVMLVWSGGRSRGRVPCSCGPQLPCHHSPQSYTLPAGCWATATRSGHLFCIENTSDQVKGYFCFHNGIR